MKWTLLFLFLIGTLALGSRSLPFSEVRRSLPAGVYRDLKPTQPLVLDTGNFTFIGLEMKNLGKGIWLDARKARSLTLIHCRFEGTGSGTAVIGSGQVEIGLCHFNHLSQAIRYEAGSHNRVKIYRNEFSGNDTAISMATAPGFETAKLELSLKCNEFINPIPNQGNSKKRIGLFLAKGINAGYTEAGIFRNHTLGADGQYYADGFSYPNGNRWPGGTPGNPGIWPESPFGLPLPDVHGPDPTLALANSPNWVSIENQSGAPLQYYRYETEFVGRAKALVGEVVFSQPQHGRKWLLDPGTTTDTCTYKTQQPKGQANLMVCEQLVDEQPFLLPTFLKYPGRKEALTALPADTQRIFMGSLHETVVHNHKAILRFWVPGKVQKAVLQYVDTEGMVLQSNPIARRGWIEAHLDFSYTQPGIYSYRLWVDGIATMPQKIVAVK